MAQYCSAGLSKYLNRANEQWWAALKAAVEANGIAACLTSADHPTGTDRLAEAARQLRLPDDAIVVNVQGAEPLLSPALIRAVVSNEDVGFGQPFRRERLTTPEVTLCTEPATWPTENSASFGAK